MCSIHSDDAFHNTEYNRDFCDKWVETGSWDKAQRFAWKRSPRGKLAMAKYQLKVEARMWDLGARINLFTSRVVQQGSDAHLWSIAAFKCFS